MPNPDTNVELDVQPGLPPDATWKKCQDSAGADLDTFCCQFTGGDWDASDGGEPGAFQSDTGKGDKNVHLELTASPIWRGNNGTGYRINDITFENNDNQCEVSGNAPDRRVIKDKSDKKVPQNQADPPGEYTVIVDYRADSDDPTVTLYCHPRWRNR